MNSPQTFGPYELTERINIGGMAEVFRAYDHAHHRLVAIKRILPSIAEDEEFIQMFRDEANIASQLDHANIAKIFDVGKVDLSYYLALEFVHGKDLRVLFDRAARAREQLPLAFVLYVIMHAAEALDYAHHRKDARGRPLGVVHRDVSPQNILVSFDGDLKIIDFGIAKAAGKLARTQVGTIKGKFGYMSPEQVRGLPIDQRSDVFSLGICCWELIALERLFAGENEIAIMEKIRAGDIPSLSDRGIQVHPGLEEILSKALAKDVDERYASAADFHSNLATFARANGLVIDRLEAAQYMRSVFAADAVIDASVEEKAPMADQKSSDLDVFEGLAKKNIPPDEALTPFAPAVSGNGSVLPVGRHKTLLGMPTGGPGTLPGGIAPPGKGFSSPLPGQSSMPPPPPPVRTRSNIPPGPPPRQMAGPDGTSTSMQGAPLQPPPPNPADLEMDWDEDEKTSVFEKNETTTVFERSDTGALHAALPGGAMVPPIGARTRPGTGPSLPPPPPPGSIPPPPLGYNSVPPPAPMGSRFPPPAGSAARLATSSASRPAPPPLGVSSMRPLGTTRMLSSDLDRPSVTNVINNPTPRPQRNRYFVAMVGALLVAGVAYLVVPRTGRVSVFASGSGGRPLLSLAVHVDGVQKCVSSPCTVELDKGVHAIKVLADGYTPQEQGATVHSGEEIALNFKLARASDGTGVKVSGKQDGVELYVDGKVVGPLPQEVKDLAPGAHKISFKGSERYAAEERTVNVDQDEMKDLGNVNLKVLRGLATFDVRTQGVKITLVSGKDRRQLNDFSQPVEIETSKSWVIEASKPGYEDFRQPIAFEDRAEKTFVIALQGKAAPEPVAVAPVAAPRPAPRPAEPRPAPAAPAEPRPAAADPEPAAAGGGECTLNFNSIPVSNVVLDGRPIGGTPKLGYSAPAGTHTVVFINNEEGRKVTSVTCKGGETKTVAVRISQ